MCGVIFQSIHVWGTGYPVQTSNDIQYQSSKWKWHSVCLFEMRLGALPQMCFANALKKEEEQAVLDLLIVMQSMWRAFLISGRDSAASRLDWYFGKSCVLVTVVEHDVVVIILNRWNCFSLVQKTNKCLIVLPRANRDAASKLWGEQQAKIFIMSGDHENSNKSYQIYKLVINTVPLNKS